MIFKKPIKIFVDDTRGLAMTEAALILPMMFVLLFGLFDLGQAMIIDQKVTAAAHVASDLITRKSLVTEGELDNAVGGAHLVIDPYDRNLLGVDIVGIQFDDEDSPVVLWRRTDNITPDPSLPSAADGLGVEGEGVVAVTVLYTYTPRFVGKIFDVFEMRETAFLRGRRTSVVKMAEDE